MGKVAWLDVVIEERAERCQGDAAGKKRGAVWGREQDTICVFNYFEL